MQVKFICTKDIEGVKKFKIECGRSCVVLNETDAKRLLYTMCVHMGLVIVNVRDEVYQALRVAGLPKESPGLRDRANDAPNQE